MRKGAQYAAYLGLHARHVAARRTIHLDYPENHATSLDIFLCPDFHADDGVESKRRGQVRRLSKESSSLETAGARVS